MQSRKWITGARRLAILPQSPTFAGLKADEGADQSTKEAGHPELASHRHQAKAGLAVTDDRLMIQRVVPKIEIARAEPAALMAETAPQDARQFSPGMGMLEHSRSRVRREQKSTRL